MAVIDFKKTLGLSVAFDGSDILLQENGLDITTKDITTIDDIRSQLLNPELTCPEVFNYHFRGIDRKSVLKRKRLKLDLLVLPSNLAGIEYVKTKGLRIRNYPILVDVVNGFVTLLIVQGLDDMNADNPAQSSVVKLKKGEKYVIPPGSHFVVINTRQPLAALAMIYSDKSRLEGSFDDTNGAPSYVIRKNARQEVVQNPAFRFVNRQKLQKPEKIYNELNLTAKTPIFKQILRKYQRFKWLHDESLVDWDKLRQ
jgi:hypothetical protein